MWLERLLQRIDQSEARLLAFDGGPAWGAPHLIAALASDDRPLIWLELTAEDAGDEVAQGNKLADAVRRALDAPLFGYGFPYRYGLAILDRHLELLGPFTIALTGSEHGLDLATALQAFATGDNRVVLQAADATVLTLPPHCLYLGRSDLALTLDEALALVDVHAHRSEELRRLVPKLLHAAERAFEPFRQLLHRELQLPPPYRPTPEGLRPVPEQTSVAPEILLTALINRRNWIEAFDVAARCDPAKAVELVEHAGNAFFERGLFQRFWKLINLLPDELFEDETLMRWKYDAAITVNQHRKMVPEVEAYLATHEAPELRVLYAASLPHERSLEDAERAYRAKKTPTTARLYGFLLDRSGASDKASELGSEALRLAELGGYEHHAVAAGYQIALNLCHKGEYRGSHQWDLWALQRYSNSGLREELRYFEILGHLVWVAMLIGDMNGAESAIHRMNISEAMYGLPSFEATAAVVGTFECICGNWDRALWLFERNLRDMDRNTRPFGGIDYVRGLIRMGRTQDAEAFAREVLALYDSPHPQGRALGELALGLAILRSDPNRALTILEKLIRGSVGLERAQWRAEAAINVSALYLQMNRRTHAEQTLKSSAFAINQLEDSGWKLLCSLPEMLPELKDLWADESRAILISALGDSKVYYLHRPLTFPFRLLETLTLLALHPDGLSSERLAVELYGPKGRVENVKSVVSKLRRAVPVASRPYRLELSLRADFLEVEELLEQGRVREAVERYKGPLLPGSQAPGIVEARERLEEAVRQAVLVAGDVEVLLQLARKLGADLEVWERARRLLSRNDPRYPLVRAQVRQIRRDWGA